MNARASPKLPTSILVYLWVSGPYQKYEMGVNEDHGVNDLSQVAVIIRIITVADSVRL